MTILGKICFSDRRMCRIFAVGGIFSRIRLKILWHESCKPPFIPINKEFFMELIMRGFVVTSLLIFSLGMANSVYLSLRYTLGGYSWDDVEAKPMYC